MAKRRQRAAKHGPIASRKARPAGWAVRLPGRRFGQSWIGVAGLVMGLLLVLPGLASADSADFSPQANFSSAGFAQPKAAAPVAQGKSLCSLSTLQIQLTNPQGETYKRGVQMITWTTSGSAAPLSTVTIGIYFWRKNGDWTAIAEGTANDGQYESATSGWNTTLLPDDNSYFVYVYAYESSQLADCYSYAWNERSFIVDNTRPGVALSAPAAGAVWGPGSQMISWTTTEAYPSWARVEYSSDGGGSWSVITDNVPNAAGPASIAWDTTSLPAGDDYKVRVQHVDKAGNAGAAVSGLFAVGPQSSSGSTSTSRSSSSASHSSSAGAAASGPAGPAAESQAAGIDGQADRAGADAANAESDLAPLPAPARGPIASKVAFWWLIGFVVVSANVVPLVYFLRDNEKRPRRPTWALTLEKRD